MPILFSNRLSSVFLYLRPLPDSSANCRHLLYSTSLFWEHYFGQCSFSCSVCLFSILCILCFCIVYPFVYSCLFPNFVQVYRQLPPGGNPNAINKYHIYICCYISWITSSPVFRSLVVIVLRDLMLPFHIRGLEL